jgi:hypothetical protein
LEWEAGSGEHLLAAIDRLEILVVGNAIYPLSVVADVPHLVEGILTIVKTAMPVLEVFEELVEGKKKSLFAVVPKLRQANIKYIGGHAARDGQKLLTPRRRSFNLERSQRSDFDLGILPAEFLENFSSPNRDRIAPAL